MLMPSHLRAVLHAAAFPANGEGARRADEVFGLVAVKLLDTPGLPSGRTSSLADWQRPVPKGSPAA